MVFQRVSVDEVQVLRDVAEDVFDKPIDLGHARKFVADPGNILIVAIEDNCVVGQIAAVVQQHVDSRTDLYIDNLGVTPRRQRKGIASRLIATVLEAGKLQGAEVAWVAVDADNEVAQSLYRKTGANGVPVFMFSYGSSADSPQGVPPA